jgi:predicted permease
MNAIVSVTIASAQSVGKVFVIGSIGYLSVKYPSRAPFLPISLVGTVARFTFHALTIPLIYSTIAVAVSPQTIGDYWFLIVGGWVVLLVSYMVATILRPCFHGMNLHDYQALRIAATFPNIVALPILIFPSLCEFSVVYEGYFASRSSTAPSDLQRDCVAQSNTMIFCYFFAWSLAFWTFGNPQLMKAAALKATTATEATTTTAVDTSANPCNNSPENRQQQQTIADDLTNGAAKDNNDVSSTMSLALQSVEEGLGSHRVDERENSDPSSQENKMNVTEHSSDSSHPHTQQSLSSPTNETIDHENKSSTTTTMLSKVWTTVQPFWVAIKQTTTSPGFVAMVLGFITACIPPLQSALFEPGGALRFLGSAVEALGTASSPISTIVVAASLVPAAPLLLQQGNHSDSDDNGHHHPHHAPDEETHDGQPSGPIFDERPGMTDPNFGPYQRPRQRTRRGGGRQRLSGFRQSMRSSSIRLLQAMPRSTPEMRRLHLWFNISRLLVTPAVIVGLILAFDCTSSGVLNDVPNLAKLVIIVNSALPGALIVVVLLKSNDECADTAAAVSKVYLPSYLISIFTIAAWCAVGLLVTLPDDNGNTICQR